MVSEDGSRRRLGEYSEATWSPFGRYVAAAGRNELAALEPDGDVRWTLPRRSVSSPSWTGTETDTRVAYVDRTGVRVVAGDGTSDRLLLRAPGALVAWRPGPARVLAIVSSPEVRVLDVVSNRLIWRDGTAGVPTGVAWSSDGRRLMVWSPRSLRVYDSRGRLPFELGPGGAPIRAAALSPDGRAAAYVMEATGQSQLWIVPRIRPDGNAARRVFAGAGELGGVTWSPDGRWLLATWPNADQWLFIRVDGRGIRAVSNIAKQFRSRSSPRVGGWCCTP